MSPTAESTVRSPAGNRRTVIVAALGAFLDGYDLVIIAGALLFIRPELGLDATQVGLVGSIVFIGMVVGALAFGRITDRVGRNTSFVFVLLLFVIGSLISATAVNAELLIIGRFIVGLGIGADLPVSTTMIAESVPAKRRGGQTGVMQAFWFGGAAFSGLVSIFCYVLIGPESWRWMLASAIVIAIVVIILRRGVTETESFTRAKAAAATAPAAATIPAKQGLRALIDNRAVRVTLIFSCLFWFLMTVRGAGFNLYTPTFLNEVGLSSPVPAMTMSMIVNVINTMAAVAAILVIDRFGRRRFVLVCWAMTTVLTLGLAAVAGGQAIAMFVLITVSALPVQAIAVAMFPLSVEAFPTLVRATAQGLSSACGKLGGFISALLFPVALSGMGWTGLALVLTGVMAAGLVVGLLLRFPETNGRELTEV